MAKKQTKRPEPATLDDVVRELSRMSGELRLLKVLFAKFIIYHGMTQDDVGKALETDRSNISRLVGGTGGRRMEHESTNGPRGRKGKDNQ